MGFAKEIEDFLSGYTTVTDMADKATARKRAAKKDQREDEVYEQGQMEDLAVDPEKLMSPSAQAAAKRAPRTSALPTTDYSSQILAPYGDNPGEEEEPVAMASGGIVPEDEEETPSALPVPKKPVIDNQAGAAARATGAKAYTAGGGALMPTATMSGAPRNTYGDAPPPNSKPGMEKVFKASDDAVKAAMQSFKGDGGKRTKAIGDDSAGRDVDFRTGKGAATPEEVKAIDAKVDPNGELSPWEKGRARLGYAYDYFVSRGEPEKAANVAKRLLLFDKMASQTRGQLAQQMIKQGDVGEGAKILTDAYNEHIHDGSMLEVQQAPDGNFAFKVSKDGKVVDEGVGTAADLAAMAGNVANGSEFVRRTARLASEAGETGAEEAAETAPDGDEAGGKAPAKPAGKRDITWAKKQYVYAASVLKTWEDAVAADPSEENKARLKDAQMRLAEAEQDAIGIRMSTVRSKTADQSKIMIDFDDDLAKWREAAEPLAAPPPLPKDGLRGAPKPAAPEQAIPTGGAAPAAPAGQVTSQGNGDAKYLGYQGGGSAWDVGGQRVTAPPPERLKPLPAEMLGQAKAALAAGKPRGAVLRMILQNGFNPTGL